MTELLRHPEFEQALFDRPDDPSAWAVYGDWLAARGDARGELIQLELALEAGVSDPSLRRRYAQLMVDEQPKWIGEELRAVLDEPDTTRVLGVEWRRGHLLYARIAERSLPEAERLLAAVLRAPTAMLLERLELFVDHQYESEDAPQRELWSEVRLESLRELLIDGWTFRHAAEPPLYDLGFDWQQTAPRMVDLRLRLPHLHLAAPRHARLRRLELSLRRGVELGPLYALTQAELPALEHLDLFLGESSTIDADELVPVVVGLLRLVERCPVRRLGLRACDRPALLLAAVREHPRSLASVERLSLGYGLLGDEHLPALTELLAALPGLRELDLRRNYLSANACSALRSAGRRVQLPGLADQKRSTPTDERHVPVFGRYGIREDEFEHEAD